MPTLADLYSAIGTAKRKASDFVQNPMMSLGQMVGNANDRAKAFNELNRRAADEAMASGNLADFSGPYGRQLTKTLADAYNPTGMTLSYRGSHIAPGPDFGAPLHDLTGGGKMYPADVYSSMAHHYYGGGFPYDKEAFEIAKSFKDKPDAMVTIYRAVPNNVKNAKLNSGDWVTLTKSYAEDHGDMVLDGEYKILSKKVKAKDLWTNADSIHEFGYHPNE